MLKYPLLATFHVAFFDILKIGGGSSEETV